MLNLNDFDSAPLDNIVYLPTPFDNIRQESTVTPTIGRIVHYHSYGTPGGEYLPTARAAIITEVHSDSVSLAVFNPQGVFHALHVKRSDQPKPGHWCWPRITREGRGRDAADLADSETA